VSVYIYYAVYLCVLIETGKQE